MAIDVEYSNAQIQDPFLISILEATASLREQTSALLDLVNKRHDSSEAEAKSATGTLEPNQRLPELSAGITDLRNRNRHLAHLVRDTKATTSVSRAEVDRLHLGLQNLYYEERHLVGEIASCEEYDHPYSHLPLISEEDFFAKFPEWISRRQEKGDGDGEWSFMKARIMEEKREREELEARRVELVKYKTELEEDNRKKKQDLANLDKQLEAHIEVCLALIG